MPCSCLGVVVLYRSTKQLAASTNTKHQAVHGGVESQSDSAQPDLLTFCENTHKMLQMDVISTALVLLHTKARTIVGSQERPIHGLCELLETISRMN